MSQRRTHTWVLTLALATGLIAGCGPSPREEAMQRYTPITRPPAQVSGGYGRDTNRQAELGRMLFFDPRLSSGGKHSCASCHDPARNLSGEGDASWRDVPALVGLGARQRFNWDAAASNLEQQIATHAADALVLDADDELITARLQLIPGYQEAFLRDFRNRAPDAASVWGAIAAFLRSLDFATSAYDRWLAGERQALNERQQQGMDLFHGKAGCIRCHSGPLASDGETHNLGVPATELWQVGGREQIAFRYRLARLGVSPQEVAAARADLGRWYVTRDPKDRAAFLTPTLRDLRHSAPYLHNGSLATLREVVDFHLDGGRIAGSNKVAPVASSALPPVALEAEERAALVAFLEALSGPAASIPKPRLPDYAVPRLRKPPPARPRSLREQLRRPDYLNRPAPSAFTHPSANGSGPGENPEPLPPDPPSGNADRLPPPVIDPFAQPTQGSQQNADPLSSVRPNQRSTTTPVESAPTGAPRSTRD